MQRDSYYDNLKFVLIAFVVVGHFALTYLHGASSKPVTVVKDWIWLFNMPAFLFVSGMFAKNLYTLERGLRVDAISFYLVMYLGFSVVVQAVMATYSDPTFDIFHVYSIPWYFLALALLGVSLPFMARIRGGARVVVPAAAAFAMIAGFNDGFGSFLSLSRVVNFAPFYYAGYFMDREALKRAVAAVQGKPVYLLLDMVLLIVVFIMLWRVPEEYASTMNNLSMAYSPYHDCGDLPLATIVCMRVAWFGLAGAMTFGISVFVPLGETLYTELGQRTMQVYILHPLVYLPMRGFDFIPQYVAPYVPFDPWVVLGGSVLLTFVLAYPKFPARWLRKLQQSIRVDIGHDSDRAEDAGRL